MDEIFGVPEKDDKDQDTHEICSYFKKDVCPFFKKKFPLFVDRIFSHFDAFVGVLCVYQSFRIDGLYVAAAVVTEPFWFDISSVVALVSTESVLRYAIKHNGHNLFTEKVCLQNNVIVAQRLSSSNRSS